MINIPATDIMSLITGEVDKAAMADRPQVAEVSFMGIINAEGSRPDEQADVLGLLMNTDMADNVGKPANFAITATIIANNPLQIQQDEGAATPVPDGLTNNATASPALLVDDELIPPAFAPYNQSMHSVVRPAMAKGTPLTFGPEPDPRHGESQPKTAVGIAGVQDRDNNLSARHTLPAGKIESPRMAPQNPLGVSGILSGSANTALQQTPVGRADNQTAIAPTERLKPEMALLDKTLSGQQVAIADHTNRKAIVQANQGPVPRSTNPEPVSAGTRHPAPQPLELPVSHSASDRMQAAPATADKPPASQAGMAIAQHAPALNSHNIPENSASQKMSAQQISSVQTPANSPGSPTVSAPLQTVIQRPIDAPTQSPERPPIYGAQPPAHPENRGQANTPEIQSANAPTPRLIARYGEASIAVAPPATSRIAAPLLTQPHSNPDVSAPQAIPPSSAANVAAPLTRQPLVAQKLEASKTIQSNGDPMAAAFEPRQLNAASKRDAGETYKTKSTPELPAPKSARPSLPQQTGAPDITGVETGAALATPEFVALEAKSAETAPLVRHDANLNRPEVMRHVAQQLTDAARLMPNRPVELALNPEELGRVRLTFTTTDAGLHVAVVAERGETMDLLRRHIESLAQDFRDLGYRDVKFDFSGNGARSDANSSGNNNPDQDQSANPDAADPDISVPVQLSLEPSAGLDLRL